MVRGLFLACRQLSSYCVLNLAERETETYREREREREREIQADRDIETETQRETESSLSDVSSNKGSNPTVRAPPS